MNHETIEWQEWTEDNQPPVDGEFLAWMGKAKEPWCCTLHAADGEGHYFILTGSSEFPEVSEATHWAKPPKGPSH